MDENFNYFDFWNSEERSEERKLQREIENFPKGQPRKGIKGKYIKPKKYISKRSGFRQMKSYVFKEKSLED
jgi:hypothetical protein